MNIVLADIDTENLEKASEELEQAGMSVLAVTLDVAEETQWQTAAERAVERFGKVHMVVNNAGVTGDPGSIEQQNTKGWLWVSLLNNRSP